MDDLATWLTQIWDEEHQTALQASPGPWRVNAEELDMVLAVDDIEVCTAFALSNNQLRWTARHIAGQDPVRVLARIAADRRILAIHTEVDPCDAHDASFRKITCDTVRLMGVRYSGRPGYREEWKP